MLTGAELPCSLIFYFYSRGGESGAPAGSGGGRETLKQSPGSVQSLPRGSIHGPEITT